MERPAPPSCICMRSGSRNVADNQAFHPCQHCSSEETNVDGSGKAWSKVKFMHLYRQVGHLPKLGLQPQNVVGCHVSWLSTRATICSHDHTASRPTEIWYWFLDCKWPRDLFQRHHSCYGPEAVHVAKNALVLQTNSKQCCT